MSSGIKQNRLDVFIGHTQKIGAITLDIGSENEMLIDSDLFLDVAVKISNEAISYIIRLIV